MDYLGIYITPHLALVTHRLLEGATFRRNIQLLANKRKGKYLLDYQHLDRLQSIAVVDYHNLVNLMMAIIVKREAKVHPL